ncbi:MAG TPA: cyanophycinase [Pantanalinema sp.]
MSTSGFQPRGPRAGRACALVALASLSLTAVAPAAAQVKSGVFVAIGGGPERAEIVSTVLQLAGGKDKHVVVMPTASGAPSESGLAYKQYFLGAGVQDVDSLPIPDRDGANELEPVKVIGRADLLYFTGGDQNRLVNTLTNTAVHGSIQTAWQRAALIAGTSAGAMVWGPEFIANGSSRGALLNGFSRDSQGMPGLELRPGLNLWDNLIVDTHFTEQQRLGRLVLAIASNQGYTGLGIDEGTAAIVTNDTIQAIGTGAVTVLETDKVSASNAETVGPGNPLAIGRVSYHRLIPGKTYLRKWKTIQEEEPLAQAQGQPPRTPYIALAGSDTPPKQSPPISDFVRASGGSQARILLLTGEGATQGARMWKTHLMRLGAAQVVNYQSIELSEQGLALALQQATGIFMLEDGRASLLKALLANQGRLAQVVIDAGNRMPMGAAGNGVRLFGTHAIFGAPGSNDYLSLPGLGILPSAVVDKAFWTTDAVERLVRSSIRGSRSLAVGLSPDNALTISGGQATVFGTSQVMFLEAKDATGFKLAPEDSPGPSGITGMSLSVVPANGSYDLIRREARF